MYHLCWTGEAKLAAHSQFISASWGLQPFSTRLAQPHFHLFSPFRGTTLQDPSHKRIPASCKRWHSLWGLWALPQTTSRMCHARGCLSGHNRVVGRNAQNAYLHCLPRRRSKTTHPPKLVESDCLRPESTRQWRKSSSSTLSGPLWIYIVQSHPAASRRPLFHPPAVHIK